MTVPEQEAPANYVPAAAVISRGQEVSGITGWKGSVDGRASIKLKPVAHPPDCVRNC